MYYHKERDVAVEAVIKASELCRNVQSELVTPDSLNKKDKSPVTVADYGAQAVITHYILTTFPHDPIVAEENSAELRQFHNISMREKVVFYVNQIVPGLSEREILDDIDYGSYDGGPAGRFWTLDPIDGTKGFLRKDQYAVALALIENGHVVLGTLGCPNLPLDARQPEGGRGVLFLSGKGLGAMMRTLKKPKWDKITVDNISDPSQALYCESFESEHSSHAYSAQIAHFLGIKKPPLRLDSQCKYAAVARGDVSIYLRFPPCREYSEKIWDHAAGVIIVEEAGGKVTDARGKPLDFAQGRRLRRPYGIIVSNGKLHSQLLATIQRVM